MSYTKLLAGMLLQGDAVDQPVASVGRYWYFAEDTGTLYHSDGATWTVVATLGGSGTVTSVGSADSSVTVTNPTTTPDLAVQKAPKLSTARTIDGQSFDGTADITVIAPGTHAATSKTTPVDADELPVADSAASFVLKKLTWANLKATLKTYFDTLYAPVSGGVSSLAKSGSTPLTGAVTLSEGANVTLTQSGNDIAIAASGGSGAAQVIDIKSFRRTAGSYTLNGTSWGNVDTGSDLVVNAATGDVIQISVSGLWGNEAVSAFLDVATIVSGSPVNYVGSGPVTTTSGDGIQGWACENATAVYTVFGSTIYYTVQSGDISAGTVTLRLRRRTTTAANKTLWATANNVFFWGVTVLRVSP